jgi:hypothetical protein
MISWECRRGESNPYTLRYRILSPARLPIPPLLPLKSMPVRANLPRAEAFRPFYGASGHRPEHAVQSVMARWQRQRGYGKIPRINGRAVESAGTALHCKRANDSYRVSGPLGA